MQVCVAVKVWFLIGKLYSKQAWGVTAFIQGTLVAIFERAVNGLKPATL